MEGSTNSRTKLVLVHKVCPASMIQFVFRVSCHMGSGGSSNLTAEQFQESQTLCQQLDKPSNGLMNRLAFADLHPVHPQMRFPGQATTIKCSLHMSICEQLCMHHRVSPFAGKDAPLQSPARSRRSPWPQPGPCWRPCRHPSSGRLPYHWRLTQHPGQPLTPCRLPLIPCQQPSCMCPTECTTIAHYDAML